MMELLINVMNMLLLPVAIVALLSALLLTILREKRRRASLLRRPDQDTTERPGDTDLEWATDLVMKVIADDLGVSASKVYLRDDLRADLGYEVDELGISDELETLLSIIAVEAKVGIAAHASFVTVLDVARYVATRRTE